MTEMEEPVNSSGLTDSSPGSSILLSDSVAMQDEFSGFGKGDSNSDVLDPFNSNCQPISLHYQSC